MPVVVRSLRGPCPAAPNPVTMQAVNWRLTDIAEESHEDNVRVACVAVILYTLRNVPLWQASIPHQIYSQHPFSTHTHKGFSILLTVTVLLMSETRGGEHLCRVVKFHIFLSKR